MVVNLSKSIDYYYKYDKNNNILLTIKNGLVHNIIMNNNIIWIESMNFTGFNKKIFVNNLWVSNFKRYTVDRWTFINYKLLKEIG